MKAEEKAMELYPIEDFPFREDAESQYKLRAAFLKGVEFAQTNQPVKDEVREAAEKVVMANRNGYKTVLKGLIEELEKALNESSNSI